MSNWNNEENFKGLLKKAGNLNFFFKIKFPAKTKKNFLKIFHKTIFFQKTHILLPQRILIGWIYFILYIFCVFWLRCGGEGEHTRARGGEREGVAWWAHWTVCGAGQRRQATNNSLAALGAHGITAATRWWSSGFASVSFRNGWELFFFGKISKENFKSSKLKKNNVFNKKVTSLVWK